MNPQLRPIAFSDLAGWDDDDHLAALRTFLAGRPAMSERTPKLRGLGIDGGALCKIADRGAAAGIDDGRAAQTFFETWFQPRRIEAGGFVTGYYEPEVAASRDRGGAFLAPLYRRPPDLVEIELADAPAGWPADMRFGRMTASGPEPYFDRSAIESGALAGRGLELAWLASPVDAFFIHVQGSARLRLSDGGTLRIAYDGKSGHGYTPIGRLLVERNLLVLAAAHRDGLAAWLAAHPAEGQALMRENRSFIFFRETGQREEDGPLGAAGVPLTPGRSLAVDRTLMTFHAPVFVAAEALADPHDAGRPFRRLMIAQDTGSAIVGPARGDIFYGSGDTAGSQAGRVRHQAAMTVLVPVSTGAG